MKRLKISSLMDEYTDTEFFPTGGSAVSPEAVKARVLASAKVQTQKKQLPRKKKLLITAALAAALMLLMGAGYPFIQRQLVNGSLTFWQDERGKYVSYEQRDDIIVEEDGRLYFAPEDGQRVDITDLISEDTPYIYDGSDPDTDLTYYIIMGGTPECYGWLTWIRTPNLHADESGIADDEFTTAYHYYFMDHTIGGQHGHMGLSSLGLQIVKWNDNMNHSWLLVGAEQVGVTFLPEAEFEAMVEAETQ